MKRLTLEEFLRLDSAQMPGFPDVTGRNTVLLHFKTHLHVPGMNLCRLIDFFQFYLLLVETPFGVEA